MQMRGTVRFRFRSPENNIDIIIEGESNVVESLRQELGLQGRVGFIQPLSARLVDDSELESHAAMGDGENLSNILTEEEKTMRFQVKRLLGRKNLNNKKALSKKGPSYKN